MQAISCFIFEGILLLLFIISNVFSFELDFCIIIFAALYVLLLGIYNPSFILRYIMLFFMAVGNILGVYICENENIWLSELAIQSFHAGSLPLIVIGWSIFITTLFLLDLFFEFSDCKKNNNLRLKVGVYHLSLIEFVPIFALILNLIILIKVIPHPFFLDGLDRFMYRNLYLPGIWSRSLAWLETLTPIFLYLVFVKRAKIGFLILLTYSLALFLTGEKFGGFWNLIVFACIIYSANHIKQSKKDKFAILKKAGVGFLCIFIILMLHLTLNTGNFNFSNNSNFLIQRFAQQGQLWWRTYSLDQFNGTRIDELQDETATYFQTNDIAEKKYNHAIYKIMRFTTPIDLFEAKIASGSRYSTSTFASMFYYFKTPGVIIYGIVGAIFLWVIMRSFIYAIRGEYLIEMYLSSKLLLASYKALSQSEFNLIFTYKNVACFLLIIAMYIVRKRFVESEDENQNYATSK